MKLDKSYLSYYFYFLLAMTQKEFKTRYKRAVMGFLWVIINPLLQMLIIGFIFSFITKIDNYYLYLLTGLIPWQFFSLSLTKATPSFVNERHLLAKAKFPREIIPLSMILSNFIHLVISLLLIGLFLLTTSQIRLTQTIILLPASLWLLAFTIGFSLITSTLNVRYRDINFFVQSGLILLFYATPILYQTLSLPPHITKLLTLNPLTGIIDLFHTSLQHQPFPPATQIASGLVITILILIIGLKLFDRYQKYFPDWL